MYFIAPKRRLTILPHKCKVSSTWIRPFSFAIRGVTSDDIDGLPYHEWIAEKEFVVLRLKGKI